MQPADLILLKPVKISIACQDVETPKKKQLAIYEVSGSGYGCEGGESDAGKVTLSTRTPGAVVVLQDAVAPVAKFSGIRTVKRLGKCLVYEVKDIGSGFNYDSVQALVAGVKSEPDSDPDKSEVYVPIGAKKAGKTDVVLTVRDKAGNTLEINESALIYGARRRSADLGDKAERSSASKRS
jgi:hypothetical protein